MAKYSGGPCLTFVPRVPGEGQSWDGAMSVRYFSGGDGSMVQSLTAMVLPLNDPSKPNIKKRYQEYLQDLGFESVEATPRDLQGKFLVDLGSEKGDSVAEIKRVLKIYGVRVLGKENEEAGVLDLNHLKEANSHALLVLDEAAARGILEGLQARKDIIAKETVGLSVDSEGRVQLGGRIGEGMFGGRLP